MNHVSSHYNSPLFVRPVRTWFTLSHKYVSDVICRKNKIKKIRALRQNFSRWCLTTYVAVAFVCDKNFVLKVPWHRLLKERAGHALSLSLSLFGGGKTWLSMPRVHEQRGMRSKQCLSHWTNTSINSLTAEYSVECKCVCFGNETKIVVFRSVCMCIYPM